MKWYRHLKNAMLREPPADWFLAGYFSYEPPEEATRKKDGSYSTKSRWSKALENTFAMAAQLGIKPEPEPESKPN